MSLLFTGGVLKYNVMSIEVFVSKSYAKTALVSLKNMEQLDNEGAGILLFFYYFIMDKSLIMLNNLCLFDRIIYYQS